MRKTRRDKIHAEMQGYTDRQKARVAARARGVRHLELIHAIEERKVKTIADAIALCRAISARYVENKHTSRGDYALHVDTGDLLNFSPDGRLIIYVPDTEYPPSFWENKT